jgi:alkanesulfonate monooxygenase SsuD/methylene tetrahydromethanopterin reductase-like flavin-dependent oxidoreductase (luciferase family)
MDGVPVGVFLPTFSGPKRRSAREIVAFARRAEELGFDSLWATDHLLHGSRFYRVPWLDPLLALSCTAGVTERVRLGTSILVMPTRHPVILAKEISTLQALSGDRYILGAGTGWDPREFEAVGATKSERGSRTDEVLAIVRRLLAGESVTFDGRHYELRHIEVGPPMTQPLEVWVAGGRQLPHPTSPEPPTLAPGVLVRIADADGWIARPTAAPAQIKEDRDEILSFLSSRGRGTDGFTVAHENFLHLVPTDDPREALVEQRRAYGEVMSEDRPFEYLEQVYLTGSLEQVRQKLDERLAAGVEYLMLHTLDPSTEQLELWAEHVLPHLGGGGTV